MTCNVRWVNYVWMCRWSSCRPFWSLSKRIGGVGVAQNMHITFHALAPYQVDRLLANLLVPRLNSKRSTADALVFLLYRRGETGGTQLLVLNSLVFWRSVL